MFPYLKNSISIPAVFYGTSEKYSFSLHISAAWSFDAFGYSVKNTAFYNAFLLLGHLTLFVICSVYLVMFFSF